MQPTANDWSAQLQAARKTLRLTRAALAQLAGVSAQTIKAYELGRRHPTRALLLALLDALKLERGQRDELLQSAGLAPIGIFIGPSRDPDYLYSPEQADAYVRALAWPAFILDDLMQVVAANALCEALWDVDVEREYPDLNERSLIRFATLPRFADRVLNWDALVGTGIAVFKGHHLGNETLEAPSTFFTRALETIMQGDPRYVSRFFELWEATQPIQPKVRWGYPVTWQCRSGATLRFQAIVTEANDPRGLAFNDWIPLDAETWEALAGLRCG